VSGDGSALLFFSEVQVMSSGHIRVAIVSILTILGLMSSSLVGCQPTSTPTGPSGSNSPALEERISALEKAVDRQSQLLSRSVGDPVEFGGRLTEIEKDLADQSKWPTTKEGADGFSKRVDTAEQDAPIQLGTQWSVRLARLKWAAAVFLMHYQPTEEDPAAIRERLDDLRIVSEERPAGIPEELTRWADDKYHALEGAANEKQRQVVQSARETDVRKADAAQIESALLQLQQFDEANDEKNKVAQKKLRVGLIEKLSMQRKESLANQLKRAKQIKNLSLRQTAVTRLYETANAELVDLILQDDDFDPTTSPLQAILSDAEGQLKDFASQQEDRTSRQVREYQRWALGQIVKCDQSSFDAVTTDIKTRFASFKTPADVVVWQYLAEFPEVRNLLSEKTGVEMPNEKLSIDQQKGVFTAVNTLTGWKYVDDLAYRGVSSAMVKFLAPIDERLLDPPVAQLFQKSFQEAWSKLEGRPEQLSVAQQATKVKKISPRDTNTEAR
jgi:hypothetical protein